AVEDTVGVDRRYAPPLIVRDVDGSERVSWNTSGAHENVDGAELAFTRATAAWTSAERETSPAMESTPDGAASALRSRQATLAPSTSNRRATASPIPLAPPVTSATRPENRSSPLMRRVQPWSFVAMSSVPTAGPKLRLFIGRRREGRI